METQTIINIVFAVAFVGYVVWQRNPTFDTITCKTWDVVDADGKMRISAGTFADGEASVKCLDKDGKKRIVAATFADRNALIAVSDQDGKPRIAAATFPDGTVGLPTKDLTPPKP